MARARAGDLDAFEELVRRYGALVRRTAALFGAGDEADDVAQEALVKAYRALDQYRPEAGAFRAWLLRIAVNETRNSQRSAGRRAALGLRLVAGGGPGGDSVVPSPEAVVVDAERRASLVAAIGTLSDKHRQVVTCRYFLELSEAEIAEVLGWPRGSVKSRLSRALDRLRRELDRSTEATASEHRRAAATVTEPGDAVRGPRSGASAEPSDGTEEVTHG